MSFATSANLLGVDTFPGWLPKSRARHTDLLISKPFLILSLIVIFLIPIQTSWEEYVFRGYLMQGIGGIIKNKWIPLLTTSLLFGFLHYWNPRQVTW